MYTNNRVKVNGKWVFIWILIISMVVTLLPMQQHTVYASSSTMGSYGVNLGTNASISNSALLSHINRSAAVSVVTNTYGSGNIPVLTAEGDGVNNLVKLQWTSSQPGQEYYMVYQKDSGQNVIDEYQSIPLNTNIRVLNVYPTLQNSDGLQNWMQTIMANAPVDYEMQVDKVYIDDFNGSDTSKNYAHYLAKDNDGRYIYDVIYFGGWDSNNNKDLSVEALQAVDTFIQYGGGILLGHDTSIFWHSNFSTLSTKYLKMDIGNDTNSGIPTIGGSKVVIHKRGFLMNYPFSLGELGDILEIPQSHSFYQFARGDVWFKFREFSWGDNTEINTHNDFSGSNNFYLSTWNNTALIQTGHSNGLASVDEQKILANTLFYLAQKSVANTFDDRMSQDVAAPNMVAGEINVAAGSLSTKKQISWTAAVDNGSMYDYYLKTISYADGSSVESTPVSATVTTGVNGYAVVVDEATNTEPSNTITTTTTHFEAEGLLAGKTYYAHIKTIDNAGNVSDVSHIPFTIDAAGLTVTSIDPIGKVNDGKTRVSVIENIVHGHRLVYQNVESDSVTIPALGDELIGFAELPENGLVEANHGDKLVVAELDTNGKVVRFGQTVAQVSADPVKAISLYALNGLTPVVTGTIDETAKTIALTVPYGTDVKSLVPTITHTGASVTPNSGTAQDFTNPVTYTVTAADGSTQQYEVTVTVSANSAKEISLYAFNNLTPAVTGTIDETAKTIALTVPYGTDVKSLVPTITHTGASVAPNSGTAQDFTSPVTYTVTAADGSTQHYVATVTVEAQIVTPQPPSTPNPSSTDGVDVLINGKPENVGIAKSSIVDNRSVLTITIDPAKLGDRLQVEGPRSVMTVPISTPYDVMVGVLNGQMIKDMELKQQTIEIQTLKASYILPALQVNIDAVSEQIGRAVELEQIEIEIEISEPTTEQVQLVEHASLKGEYTLVVPPIHFSVKARYGDVTIDVSKFNAYVERTIAIPEGVDPSKITTGVVIDQDGTMRHVPTKLELVDGKYYATINSLTNSMYTLIWHEVAFKDVAGHWAEESINEMGSRMVVRGISEEMYNPNQAITRAEFAAVIARALGVKAGEGDMVFTDINESAFYSGDVQTAISYKLFSGYEDGSFRPDELLTREQAMVVIARAMEVTGLNHGLATDTDEHERLFAYIDSVDVANWAKESVVKVLEAGIVTGRSSSQFAPQAFISRAEVAVIIQRLLQKSNLI